MLKTFDCAVVGAGSFGVWTALRLRESGRSVALIDSRGPGNMMSSSSGESRIIRNAYGADAIYSRMSMESLAEWKAAFARVCEPHLFVNTGVLWTLRQGHPHAGHTARVLYELGATFEELDHEDLVHRFPEFHFDPESRAVFEPEGGALRASRAVQAVARIANEAGVVGIEARASLRGGELVLDNGDAISAGTIIFACGPWLPALFPDIVGPRIRPTRQAVFYFDLPPAISSNYAPPKMPIWVEFSDAAGGYTFPNLTGSGLKLALDRHGETFDPEHGSRETTLAEALEARAWMDAHIPALKGAPFTRSEVCQYENTSNGDFLIDRHPEFANVWLAGGGSGHGFKHGPAVGRYIADLIDGRTVPEPRFSLATKSTTHSRAVY